MARAPTAVRRTSASGSSKQVMNTSTRRPGGAGGVARSCRRHTVMINIAKLTMPYVSASTSTTENTGASGLSVLVQRQTTQYTPTSQAIAATKRVRRSCVADNRGTLHNSVAAACVEENSECDIVILYGKGCARCHHVMHDVVHDQSNASMEIGRASCRE